MAKTRKQLEKIFNIESLKELFTTKDSALEYINTVNTNLQADLKTLKEIRENNTIINYSTLHKVSTNNSVISKEIKESAKELNDKLKKIIEEQIKESEIKIDIVSKLDF